MKSRYFLILISIISFLWYLIQTLSMRSSNLSPLSIVIPRNLAVLHSQLHHWLLLPSCAHVYYLKKRCNLPEFILIHLSSNHFNAILDCCSNRYRKKNLDFCRRQKVLRLPQNFRYYNLQNKIYCLSRYWLKLIIKLILVVLPS